MQKEIVVALVVATGAIVAAIIGTVTAILAQRSSRRSSVEIELLRAHVSKTAWIAEIAEKQFLDDLAAHAAALQSLQTVRDELRLLVTAGDEAYLAVEAVKRLRAATADLAKSYQQHYSSLGERELGLWHHAKNVADQASLETTTAARTCRYTSELSDTSRSRLIAYRAVLTDAQEAIRNHKHQLIAGAVLTAMEGRGRS